MTAPAEQIFATHAAASAALAGRVAADLAACVAEHGAAALAVPGGSTPAEFLSSLAEQPVDWPRVTVLLTDERWVPPGHPRSNTALVQRTLGSRGAAFRWFSLWRADVAPRDAVGILDKEAAAVRWPLDVVVLGMGEDGHVASLFPGSPGAAAANSRFVDVSGPGDEPRISLSAAALSEARNVYLLLRGEAKLEVLRRARGSDLPVARLLADRGGRVHVFASR